ncbi:hypothetical protein BER93_00615 [Xanthomonas fragariae]|nr:hypothetical protein BER92_00620 [Xanthomonas fragariae]AOD16905.1 hypothetical protein BER93_00615 [Xanthomonas fragariae]ENZ96513.1 DNA binding protein [Xanthomonas fragariae LMG 25863]
MEDIVETEVAKSRLLHRRSRLRPRVAADQAALEIRADRQSSHRSTGKYDPSLALAFRISRLFGESIEHVFRYEDGQ